MELTPLSNLIIALIILLLAAAVYLAYYLRALKETINKLAYRLYFEVTRKADLIPQFVEHLAHYYTRDGFAELIKVRAESMKNEHFDAAKKESENQLWEMFDKVLQAANNNTEVQKDLAITALNKDLRDAEKRVEEIKTEYNKLVKKFNGWSGNFLLKPVSMMVRAGRFETF